MTWKNLCHCSNKCMGNIIIIASGLIYYILYGISRKDLELKEFT